VTPPTSRPNITFSELSQTASQENTAVSNPSIYSREEVVIGASSVPLDYQIESIRIKRRLDGNGSLN